MTLAESNSITTAVMFDIRKLMDLAYEEGYNEGKFDVAEPCWLG